MDISLVDLEVVFYFYIGPDVLLFWGFEDGGRSKVLSLNSWHHLEIH
jgi:hypothetical protein